MEILKKTDLFGKAKISQISSEIVNTVESGEVNVLEAVVLLKTMSKAIEDAEAKLKPLINSEIAKYDKGGANLLGATLSLMEGGTKYDFSKCNDSELNDLNVSLFEIEEKINKRKIFLKSLPKEGLEIVVNEGECVRIFPPSKTSTSTFKVVFK